MLPARTQLGLLLKVHTNKETTVFPFVRPDCFIYDFDGGVKMLEKFVILRSWYRASRNNIKETNTLQLDSDLYYCTS